ncbi:MAG: GNAT family N-acetyltransferase [Clostridium sp.]|nr:GNAT family N-acetyltransferase [Clostridium sp.]
MLTTTKLTEGEMRQFAEVFAYYDYGDEEIGMVPFYPGYPDRTKLINYLLAMIRVANDCNAIYSTGKRNEGILILTDTTNPYPTAASLKMMRNMIKALGIRGFKSIMDKFQAGGESLERKYRKEKRAFVQIELLAVKKEYQGQGFMRPLVETAFEVADRGHLPVILSTDAKLKKDKYEHLGFKQVNVRQMDEKSFMYDMVREQKK